MLGKSRKIKGMEFEVSSVTEEDMELLAYINGIRFKKKLLGIDELELWSTVINIQQYYDRKFDEFRRFEEGRLTSMLSQMEELTSSYEALTEKCIWLIRRLKEEHPESFYRLANE